MEILRHNFHENCPKIKSVIEQCDFICLDTEFTGLRPIGGGANDVAIEPDNYFDDGAERYRKQGTVSRDFTLCQLGVACFTKNPQFNKYEAQIFNVFLFPRSIGSINRWFACETGSLLFLRQNNFDFNKFIHHGVPYMRRSDALAICQQIDAGLWLDDDRTNDSFIREAGGMLMDWISVDRPDEESLEIEFAEPDPLRRSLVVFQLSKMFPSIKFDANSSADLLKAEKLLQNGDNFSIAKSEKDQISSKNSKNNEIFNKNRLSLDKLRDDLLGAAVIFDYLEQSNKLLIGHNCFFDFLYLYEKFYRPLPKRYDQFKRDLHKLFPRILDTKHIALNMSQSLIDDFGCKSTSLSNLYDLLESKSHAKFAKSHQAHVELSPESRKYENVGDMSVSFLHEAGYDAFLCGLVFLRLSHLQRFKDCPSVDTRPLSFAENLSAVADWMNRLNLIQAATPYSNLIGPDPVANRPHWLVVTGRSWRRRFWPSGGGAGGQSAFSSSGSFMDDQLMKRLSSFGNMDFRPLSSNRYLIAVGTQDCANLLLEKFRNDALYTVQRYNFFKHSRLGGAILWSSTILAATFSLLVVTRRTNFREILS